MQKIILVSLCMYAKNNLIPRICFYPEVGISKRKSWQFSAERSEEKLETDPSPSYQLVGLLGVSAAACYIRNRKTKRGLKSNKPYMNQGAKKERILLENPRPYSLYPLIDIVYLYVSVLCILEFEDYTSMQKMPLSNVTSLFLPCFLHMTM